MAPMAMTGRLIVLTVVIGICFTQGVAQAARWRVKPGVAVSESFSDNITQAPDASARHDFVSTISPSVIITGEGRRLDLNLIYAPEYVDYARNSGRDELQHTLQSRVNAELWEDRFFIDFTADARQRNVSSRGNQSVDSISVNSNRAQSLGFSISPFFKHHLGPYADTNLRYFLGRTTTEGASGSTTNRWDLTIDSGRYFSQFDWKLNASRRTTSSNASSPNKFRDIQLTFGYPVNRSLRVSAGLGYEDNDIETSRSSSSNTIWSLGANWRPSPRTRLDVAYSKRFFGDSITVDGQYRFRRAVVNIGMSRDATSSEELQAQSLFIPLEDPFGEPILDPLGNPLFLQTSEQSVTRAVIVTQAMNAGFALSARRTNYALNLNRTVRESEASANDEKIIGVNASVTRRLSRKTSASAIANWQRTEFGTADDRRTLWSMRLEMSHQIAPGWSGSVSARHVVTKFLPTSTSDYTENRVAATVRASF